MKYLIAFLLSTTALGGSVQDIKKIENGVAINPKGQQQVTLPDVDQYVVDLSNDANFTAGKVVFTRIGNLVTMSIAECQNHPSATSRETAVGTVPQRFLSDGFVSQTYYAAGATAFARMSVTTDGKVAFFYGSASSSCIIDGSSFTYFLD